MRHRCELQRIHSVGTYNLEALFRVISSDSWVKQESRLSRANITRTLIDELCAKLLAIFLMTILDIAEPTYLKGSKGQSRSVYHTEDKENELR